MLGHPLSLSRCLLDCKKENRGEYLDEYLLKILESPSAKIKSQNANPPKTKKRKESAKLGKGWMVGEGGRREKLRNLQRGWLRPRIENAEGAAPTQIYSSVLELVHWMGIVAQQIKVVQFTSRKMQFPAQCQTSVWTGATAVLWWKELLSQIILCAQMEARRRRRCHLCCFRGALPVLIFWCKCGEGKGL